MLSAGDLYSWGPSQQLFKLRLFVRLVFHSALAGFDLFGLAKHTSLDLLSHECEYHMFAFRIGFGFAEVCLELECKHSALASCMCEG